MKPEIISIDENSCLFLGCVSKRIAKKILVQECLDVCLEKLKITEINNVYVKYEKTEVFQDCKRDVFVVCDPSDEGAFLATKVKFDYED